MGETDVYVFGLRGIPNVQGGVEKHCEELYPRLAGMGVNVTVFTRRPHVPPGPAVTQWNRVRLRNLWSPRQPGFEAFVHSLLAAVCCVVQRPSLVHVHNMGPGLMIPLLRAFQLRVVLTYHSIDYQHSKWGIFARALLRLGECLSVRFADQVIVLSGNTKDYLAERSSRQDTAVVPNGIGVADMVAPGKTLLRYGLVRNGYIFTAARITPEKGLHDLVKAYQSLDNPGCKLVIAGDADHPTPYSDSLKHAASRVPGIVLTGYIHGRPLAELFSNAALFVLPSHSEGLPIALLEALGYGLSALASDIPANREVGLGEDRYFPAGDPQALAAKLECWMRKGPLPQEERRQQIGAVRRRYNWDSVAEQVLEVYCHALGMAPPAPRESV